MDKSQEENEKLKEALREAQEKNGDVKCKIEDHEIDELIKKVVWL